MNIFLSYSHFLKESAGFRSIHLGEPKHLTPDITYDGETVWYQRDYDMTEKGIFKNFARDLSLDKGEIFFDKSEFIVSGITKGGNTIYVSQVGEFDMYGGPVDPNMEKPTVTVNGMDILDEVKEKFIETHGELDLKYPDMTRTDIWGVLADKHPSYFKSKRLGI